MMSQNRWKSPLVRPMLAATAAVCFGTMHLVSGQTQTGPSNKPVPQKAPKSKPAPKARTATLPVEADPRAVETEYWNSIKDSNVIADFEGYLTEYPIGLYASLARLRLQRLRATVPNAVQSHEVRSFDLGGIAASVDMVLVGAGTFSMGSLSGNSEEQPIHKVTISRPYYLGKYEVTQEQWAAVMGTNPSHFRGSNLPVDSVSWDDVQKFIRALNARTGGGWRLPTEAEWEYACRAGTTGDYAGNLDEMGWYSSNSGSTTHPVGQKQPNAWGLFDMHGNVWEWCQDWSGAYKREEQTDPTGAAVGSNRVARGGRGHGPAALCRSAYRGDYSPEFSLVYLGFRLAKTP